MKLRLRDILCERALTLTAFSEMSGISQPNLSNYINGNTSPTLDMLNRMAECLSVDVSDLLREPDEIEVFIKYKGVMYRISDKDIINILKEKTLNG